MWTEVPIRRDCDIARTLELCDILIGAEIAKTLAEEIRDQVRSRYIKKDTYERLSRWVHPERNEPQAQPVAEQLSYELFGFTIARVYT